MARMTEEETAYCADYYTKNPPTPGHKTPADIASKLVQKELVAAAVP